MSSVDNRLVKMSFDNAEFEKRASTSIGTLDKLKQALNFSGATKGIEDIKTSADSVKFDGILSSLEAIQSRFSVLGEFAHNTFMGMVNSAVDAGKSIASALTIDAIKDGFAEYETQMNSIQTILANTESKGENIDTITRALGELNTYADKTIYNFTEMTRNIGTFTAAGVGLQESVDAIQGIANLAATAGVDSTSTSRLMYQLSQALSTGYVQLMDWRSVENAGASSEAFKNAIIETARVHGVAIDEMIEEAGNFRNTLNAQDYEPWFTKDILLESLEKFRAGSKGITQEQLDQMQALYRERGYTEAQIKSLTDAQHVLTQAEIDEERQYWKNKGYNDEQIDGIMHLGQTATEAATKVKTFHQLIDTLKEALGSGWTKSWELIIGDFEQAKALWTEINDILSIYINASTNARNAMLTEWNQDANGRAAVIDGLRNAFQALLGVLLPLKEAFDSVFEPLTSADLIEKSMQFRDFTASLKITDDQAKTLKDTAIQFFSGIKTAFEGIANIGSSVINILGAIGQGIKNAINPEDILHVTDLVDRFKQFTEAIKPSEQALYNISRLVTGITSVFRALGSVVINASSALFDALGRVFTDLMPTGSNFMDLLGQIGEWLTNLAEHFEGTFDYDAFAGGFNSMADATSHFIDTLAAFTHLDDILTWFKNFFTIAENGAHNFDIMKSVADIFDKICTTLSNIIGNIDLSKIDIFAIFQSVLSTATLKKVYDLISKIYNNLTNTEEVSSTLGTLRQDLKEFMDEVIKNLDIIKTSLVDTLSSIQNSVNSSAILKIGIAIGVLVLSLAKLAEMDPVALAGAMVVVTALMLELTVMTNQLAKIELTNPMTLQKISTTMIKIAAAIWILADAVKDLAAVDPESLGRGLGAITTLLAEMLGVAVAFSKMKGDISKGAAELIKFSAALWVLAKVVKDLAAIPVEQLQSSIGALTILIAELVAAAAALSNSKLMQNPAQLNNVAKALVVFSVAVKLLASVVKDFAEIGFEDLVKGLLGLAAIMAALVFVANSLPTNFVDPTQIMKVSKALVVFSAAVKILASIVKDFAEIELNSLIAGLAGLVVIMASLVLAAKSLSELDLKGFNAAALGLGAFVGSVKTLSTIVLELGKLSFQELITGLLGLAGVMAGLVVVAKLFSDPNMDPAKIAAVSGALLIFSLAMSVMTVSMTALAALGLPGIAIALIGMAGAIAILGIATQQLAVWIPEMIQLAGAITLFGLGLALVGAGIGVATAGIALLVTTLVAAGASVALVLNMILDFIARLGAAIGEFFVGFVATLAENAPIVLEAISTIFQTIILAIQENVPLLLETLWLLLTTLLEQLAEYVPRMAEAGLQIIQGFLQAIAEHLPEILDSGITIALEFIRGVTERLPEIIDSAFKLIISFINGLAEAIRANHQALFDAIGNLISAIVEAIVDGVTQLASAVGDWFTGPGGILDTIGGFFSDLFEAGANLVQGFIDGLLSMPGAIWDAACSLATDAWNAITGTLDEHSPSRLTFGGGVNFVLGFINGITSLKERVKQESAATAFAAIDSFNENIDSESIYSPVITPVIDMTEFQNGINSMDSMIYSLPDTYDISANIARNNSIPDEMLNVMSSPNDYSSILDRMDILESNFSQLIDKMTNLNIILDSGELVGAMTPGIDNAMGMRAVLSTRGVF